MKYAHIKDKQLLGWYSTDVHGDLIPRGCIEVSDDVWAEALKINANAYIAGKFVVHDFRTEAERADDAATVARHKRDELLAATDYILLRAVESGKKIPKDWGEYRQALRDLPAQKGFPLKIKWPTTPVVGEKK